MTTDNDQLSLLKRAARVAGLSLKLGSRTGLVTLAELLKVMIPVMLVMSALEAWKVLPVLARVFEPVMALLGLPGNAALVFVAGATVNLYTALAVAANVPLTIKQLTVLAILCLDCHNLPVECAVQKKAGNGVFAMIGVRFLTGLAGALVFSWLIPATGGWAAPATTHPAAVAGSEEGWAMFRASMISNGYVLLKVIIIVMALMILVELLRQTGGLKLLTWLMRPLVWLAGVPREAAFTVMASSTLGLAYGAGLVIAEAKQGHISREGQFRTNVFIGTTHSLLEDTGLFAVLGASVWCIVLGRLVIGALAVRVFGLAWNMWMRYHPEPEAPTGPEPSG